MYGESGARSRKINFSFGKWEPRWLVSLATRAPRYHLSNLHPEAPPFHAATQTARYRKRIGTPSVLCSFAIMRWGCGGRWARGQAEGKRKELICTRRERSDDSVSGHPRPRRQMLDAPLTRVRPRSSHLLLPCSFSKWQRCFKDTAASSRADDTHQGGGRWKRRCPTAKHTVHGHLMLSSGDGPWSEFYGNHRDKRRVAKGMKEGREEAGNRSTGVVRRGIVEILGNAKVMQNSE